MTGRTEMGKKGFQYKEKKPIQITEPIKEMAYRIIKYETIEYSVLNTLLLEEFQECWLNIQKEYKKKRGFIYILVCWNREKRKYYVGETVNILSRLSMHDGNFQRGKAAKTSKYKNKLILYLEIIENRNKRMRLNRESEINAMTIEEKENLIQNMDENMKLIVKVLNFLKKN